MFHLSISHSLFSPLSFCDKPRMKIVGIGNDSTAFANKTTKNYPVVGNREIYVLYIATLFETIIFSASFSLPVYSSQDRRR